MAASLPVHPLATPCRTRIGGTFAFIFQVKIAAVISIVPAINPPHKIPKRGFTVPPSRALPALFHFDFFHSFYLSGGVLPASGCAAFPVRPHSGGFHDSFSLLCFAPLHAGFFVPSSSPRRCSGAFRFSRHGRPPRR